MNVAFLKIYVLDEFRLVLQLWMNDIVNITLFIQNFLDEISQHQQLPSPPLMSSVSPEQIFVGYVGYMESQKTAEKTFMPVSSQSIYAPLDPVVCTQCPLTSALQHSTGMLELIIILFYLH